MAREGPDGRPRADGRWGAATGGPWAPSGVEVDLAEGSKGFVGKAQIILWSVGKLPQLLLDKPCHYYCLPF